MTREEIRTRILYQLNDSPTAPTYWHLHELDEIIQEAQEILAEEAEGLHRTASIPRHDGMQFITLASIGNDVMAPYRIWDPDNERRLQFVSMWELDRERHRWMELDGDRPFWWFPVAWNLFGIHPRMVDGAGTLQIDYLAWPEDIVEDHYSPQWPTPDHDSLVLYGVYHGLMKQHDVVRATDLFIQFISGWKDAQFRNSVNRIEAGRWVRNGDREGPT